MSRGSSRESLLSFGEEPCLKKARSDPSAVDSVGVGQASRCRLRERETYSLDSLRHAGDWQKWAPTERDGEGAEAARLCSGAAPEGRRSKGTATSFPSCSSSGALLRRAAGHRQQLLGTAEFRRGPVTPRRGTRSACVAPRPPRPPERLQAEFLLEGLAPTNPLPIRHIRYARVIHLHLTQ
jgi:hypothetical protein